MKRHLLLSLTLLLATVLFAACRHDSFTLQGTLANGAGKTVYIAELTPRDGENTVATITLDKDGSFTFKHKMEYQTFYNVHVNQSDYIVLLPQAGEKIKLTGDYNMLTLTYDVKGSPESILLWQLQDYSNQGNEELTALVGRDNHNRSTLSDEAYAEAKAATDSVFLDIYSRQAQYMSNFILDYPNSLATLIALYKPFNNRPLLPPEQNVELYETVLLGLEEQHSDNPHTIHFKNAVEEVKYRYGQREAMGFALETVDE